MLTTLLLTCLVLFSFRIYLLLSGWWNRKPFVWLTGTQWAVVTGATDGTGYEFARQLALKGYHLMLISRNPCKLKATKEKILSELAARQTDTEIVIRTLAVDFTRLDIYDKIQQFLNPDKNDIYVLCNNVGICANVPEYFINESPTDHLELVNVNVIACYRMIEIVLPSMASKSRGLVINVGSIAGRHWFSLSSAYSASKAFVHQLSECLALEYRNKGITFCTLYPSAVATKMIHNAKQDFMTVSPEKYVQSVLDSIRYQQSVHMPGYWAHSALELLVNMVTFFTSKETVGVLIERCSLGYRNIVKQLEKGNQNGEIKQMKTFHMWNALTQKQKDA